MKKAGLYILLLSYVIVQLRPLTVLVEDVIAHTFFKMQHMATVHYENGHYHLHNELKTINEQDNDSNKASHKSSSSQKTDKSISDQLVTELSFDFYSNSLLIPEFNTSVLDVALGFTKINSPPPKTV